MIQIQNTSVFGWETAIRGMRNPMNSWSKGDSWFGCTQGDYGHTESSNCNEQCKVDCQFCLGTNDYELMRKLVNAGSDHSKFLRMINVTVDLIAPLYWWKEFDTYKVGTVRNSCSTMHKIHERPFNFDDFSCEHLIDDPFDFDSPMVTMSHVIDVLNFHRDSYIRTKDKKHWWQLIQLLPSSYNQRATVQMNYAVLRNMYHARKNHKLDEWHDFCRWIDNLPYSELITD